VLLQRREGGESRGAGGQGGRGARGERMKGRERERERERERGNVGKQEWDRMKATETGLGGEETGEIASSVRLR